MKPILLHISTDLIYIWSGDDETTIEYTDLERTLPGVFVQKLKEYNADSIVVINGPGGFTALRIGAIIVNLIKQEFPDIAIYDRSKIDLFGVYNTLGLLPQKGYVGLGQKKKAWLYDRSTDLSLLVSMEDIETDTSCNEYFIDMIGAHLLLDQFDQSKKIAIQSTLIGLECVFEGKSMTIAYEELCIDEKIVELLEPNYMIQPTLN